MREIFTTAEARERGLSRGQLSRGVQRKQWVHAGCGAWARGGEPATFLDRSVAAAKTCRGAISGKAAAEFYGLDSVVADRVDFTVPPGSSNARQGARRRWAKTERVDGIDVTTGTQTLIDLAACLHDIAWEHALESALRKRLTTVADIEAWLPVLQSARTKGVRRIRRVLALRPPGAAPTESLLETLAVQLFRGGGIPTPVRQFELRRANGTLIARVDLAWPELGVFVELDGEHHAGQSLYDASRQTAIVAATGWLCARFTWRQITQNPASTLRELRAVLQQAWARRAS